MCKSLWKTGIILFLFSYLYAVEPPTICQLGLNSTPNIVGLWHMNFDEDPIRDSSTNNNTGTLVGAGEPNFVSGKFGGAYDFDGNNDYISIPDSDDFSPSTTDKLTVEFWFNSTETQANQYLVTKGKADNYEWAIPIWDDGIVVSFWTAAGGDHVDPKVDTSNNYCDGIWHHLALTYELDVAVKLYVDGILLDTETTFVGDSTNGEADLELGAGTQFSAHWDGILDEVTILNRVMSAAEIENIYYRNPRS